MENKYLDIDLASLNQAEIYKLMIGLIVPRPIAFVSTSNPAGLINVAPFSYFNAISSKPACVMISISYRADGLKDTLNNIIETKELVINSCQAGFIDQVVAAAAEYPSNISEVEQLGLTTIPSLKVKPPRIKESAFQMECRLYDLIKIGNETEGSQLVIAEILMFHVAKDIYQGGKVNYEKYNPVARLGGAQYANLTNVYEKFIPKI